MTLEEKQNGMIREITAMGDCFEQYSYLIFKSGELPPTPEELCDEAHLVPGCQSTVYLSLSVRDGRLSISAWTETLIIRGVLQILRDLFEGEPIKEIAALEVTLFEKTELGATFTSDRNTGVQSILRRIRHAAEYE